MSDTAPLEPKILKLFAEAKGHQLSATSLKGKLTGAKSPLKGTDPADFDRALTALIDAGKIAVTGGGKTGHHPRSKGSYKLTDVGKDHAKPAKPDVSDETLGYQEAYILLQMIRFDGQTAKRSELNAKLKSAVALSNLEFPRDDSKGTIDYHLRNLVAAGSLDEVRQGVSVIYTLTDAGKKALGAADQHETVNFQFKGAGLNALLALARDSSAGLQGEQVGDDDEHGTALYTPLEHHHIHDYIAQLRSEKYAGRKLIPIYEVRSLVAKHHGDEAAGHAVFDDMLRDLRGDDSIELTAISNHRDASPEQLEAAVPGMGETLFYIVAK